MGDKLVDLKDKEMSFLQSISFESSERPWKFMFLVKYSSKKELMKNIDPRQYDSDILRNWMNIYMRPK